MCDLFDGEGGEVGGLVVLPALEVDRGEEQQDARVRRVLGIYSIKKIYLFVFIKIGLFY